MVYVGGGGTGLISGKNVIAQGTSMDVFAGTTDIFSTATVNLDHSNYSTASTGTNGTITPAGTNFNQTTEPQFVNPAIDDYHQLASSPTIDAGTTDGFNGLTDLDGDARTLGSAPDIGADEFVPVASPTPPAVTPDPPPETTITKKPKRKTAKRRARFSFSSDDPAATFRCKLDRGKYKACRKPFSVRVKPGKHVLRVVAVDAAGNPDSTPAVFRWRVSRG